MSFAKWVLGIIGFVVAQMSVSVQAQSIPKPTAIPTPSAVSSDRSSIQTVRGRSARWEVVFTGGYHTAQAITYLDHGVQYALTVACVGRGQFISSEASGGYSFPLQGAQGRLVGQVGSVQYVTTFKNGRSKRIGLTGYSGGYMARSDIDALKSAESIIMRGQSVNVRISASGSAAALNELERLCARYQGNGVDVSGSAGISQELIDLESAQRSGGALRGPSTAAPSQSRRPSQSAWEFKNHGSFVMASNTGLREDGSRVKLMVSCQNNTAEGVVAFISVDNKKPQENSGGFPVFSYSSASPAGDGSNVTLSEEEYLWLSEATVNDWMKAEYLNVLLYGEDVRISGSGSGNAIRSVIEFCQNRTQNVPSAPTQSRLPSDIPAEFAAGTLELQKRGGCSETYRNGGYRDVDQIGSAGDWAGATRRAIELGCDTNIFYVILGITAERYGYPDAALAYYDKAIALTDNVNFGNIFEDCNLVSGVSNPCMSIDPRAVAIQNRNAILNSR